jgi:predicted GTPase
MTHLIKSLREWFESRARPFLEQHATEKVVELDQDLDRLLRTDLRASEELTICFLGASGVGKSTLINALVAGQENVLPSGGIGPLTALAMQVRYSEEARFEAEYQTLQNLWRLVFALEQTFKRQELAQRTLPIEDTEAAPESDELIAGDDLQLDGEPLERKFDQLRRQAQKLVTDNQHSDVPTPYLLDRLREVCGRKPIWGTTLNPEDTVRLRRLTAVLSEAKEGRRHSRAENGDRAAFLQDLADHATGFLAPIIREIHVYWNSPLLRPGITLVDLPGIGVAGDVYKEVTRKWIVEKARAVVLVVDNRGVKDADAELLRRSDFLTRLLFSVDDPKADPAVLIAAVTQLDSPAVGRYFQNQAKKKREHLADVFDDTIELVKNQIRQQLLSTWAREGQAIRTGHERVVDHVVGHLRVFPVSAFEFRRLLKNDEDDRAFINEIAQSGVPHMQAGITEIGAAWQEEAAHQRDEATKTFVERVLTTLEVVEALWQQDTRAGEEAEALRRELEEVVRPMRDEFLVSKGEFRGFLRNEVPRRIEALVSDAAQEAHKDIEEYLRGLEDARWNTLKAAVTRDGAYTTGARHIHLPDDFSQMFVEPIAEVWGERLLQEIRKRTRTFTDDCVVQLETLVEWCRIQGTRVQPKLLDKHVASIKADTKQVNMVGKEAIANLRNDVKNRLKVSIEKPIKRRCQEFVRKGDHIGAGVKGRILVLFKELANTATADAKVVAVEVLTQGFKIVDQDLKEVTKSFDHPLDAAMEAIVAAHEDRLKRGDAKKRKGVLEAVEQIIATCPGTLSAPDLPVPERATA